MNLWRDLIGGWKARPLPFAAMLLLCFGLSLLIGGGLLLMEKSRQETKTLLAAWPKDQSTLLLNGSEKAALSLELQNRLPAHQWLGIQQEGDTAWIIGTLPEAFFQGYGHSLSPHQISKGEAVALLSENAHLESRPGELFLNGQQAFRIMGVGSFPLPVQQILPLRAKTLQNPAVDSFLVQLPASELKSSIQDLLTYQSVRLVDHQEKQQLAKAGFEKLQRNLLGITLAVAFVVALLLQALYQAEIRERKSEFALRRSLGATPNDIRNQILLEALIGSAFPTLLGYSFFLLTLPLPILATAIGLTLGWMLLCATLPAVQAARIPPGEALKGE